MQWHPDLIAAKVYNVSTACCTSLVDTVKYVPLLEHVHIFTLTRKLNLHVTNAVFNSYLTKPHGNVRMHVVSMWWIGARQSLVADRHAGIHCTGDVTQMR
jgi:hypothetical protein